MANSQKIFNFYINDINLSFMRDLCMKGNHVIFSKGDKFCGIGEIPENVGFITKGAFKYKTENKNGKEFTVGFAFENTFVADYPHCFQNQPSDVTIEALTDAEVYVLKAEQFYNSLKNTPELERIANAMFNYVYSNFLDAYRLTPKERYMDLLSRYPHLAQDVSLHEIASYLNITQTYLSRIRKEVIL